MRYSCRGVSTLRFFSGTPQSSTATASTTSLRRLHERAAGALVRHLPALPAHLAAVDGRTVLPTPSAAEAEPQSPYQHIAADLRGAIVSGVLPVGAQLPTVEDLAARYSVSHGTAQRAVAVLREAGYVAASRGRRAVVAERRETGEAVGSV